MFNYKKISKYNIAVILVLSLVLSFIGPIHQFASAATYKGATADDRLKAYLYTSSLRKCFLTSNGLSGGIRSTKISESDANSGDWFWSSDNLHESGGETDKCAQSSWVTGAASFFGYGSPSAMLDDFKMPKKDGYYDYDQGAVEKNIYGALSAKWGGPISMGQAEWYQHLYSIFSSKCEAKVVTDGNSSNTKEVTVAKGDGSGTEKQKFSYTNTNAAIIIPSDKPASDPWNWKCSEVADKISENAQGYADFVKKWKQDNPGKDYPSPAGASDSSTSEDGGKSTCTIKGIGWIVCPVMNFISEMFDSLYNQLASFLAMDSSLLRDNDAKTAWEAFRNIANILFVVGFIIIVYSQLTTVGISNYGVKKLLPKLIIAAIAVNMSFYLCAAAVDISNAFGFGMRTLFESIGTNMDMPPGADGWATAFMAIALAATAGIVLVAMGSGVIIFGLLALFLIVVILVLRKAIILMLVLISPLAFVAYLLPNTEKYFYKWAKLLGTLLMLFPVVGVMFGISGLAAGILYKVGGPEMQIAAIGVLALPYLLVPSLLKGSLDATGKLGQKLGGYAGANMNKASASGKKKAAERWGNTSYMQGRTMRKSAKQQFRRKKLANNVLENNFRGRLAKGARGFTPSKIPFTNKSMPTSESSDYTQSELTRQALAVEADDESKSIKNEALLMQKQEGWNENNRLDNAEQEYVSAMRSNDTIRARAAQSILLGGGNKGISQAQRALETLSKDGNYKEIMASATGQKAMSDMNAAGLKGKNAALAQLAYSPAGTTVGQIANSSGTYNALNDAEMAGQSVDNMRNAVNSGGLSQQRAVEMMNNENVWGALSEEKKNIIRDQAGTSASSTPSNPVNAATSSAQQAQNTSTPSAATTTPIVTTQQETKHTPPSAATINPDNSTITINHTTPSTSSAAGRDNADGSVTARGVTYNQSESGLYIPRER